MATIASLNAVFGMKTSGFEKGAKKVSKETHKMAAEMRRLEKENKGRLISKKGVANIKKAGLAIAGLVTGLAMYTMKMAAAADATMKFSRRLGVNFEEMQKLEHIAKLTGTSSSVMQRGLKNMTKGISEAAEGTGIAKKEIDALGLSAERLREQSPDKQFMEIAKAMKGVKNTSDKVRIAFGLFGGKGVDLINTLNELETQMGRINNSEALSAGILSEEQAKRFEALNDDMADLGLQFKGVMADNSALVADGIRGAAKVGGAIMTAYLATAGAISKTYTRWTNSEEELNAMRKEAKLQIERQATEERYIARLKKEEVEAERKITEEIKKQNKLKIIKGRFESQTKSLIESELKGSELAIKKFVDFRRTMFNTPGADTEQARSALEILRKRYKEEQRLEKEAIKTAEKVKIESVQKEKLAKEKAMKDIQDKKIAEIKKNRILSFDDAISKQKAEIDAIKGNKISDSKLGFAQAISKGVTSKGLASGATQINKKQLDTQKKQLKVAEDTLTELKEKRQLLAS